jgi:hypothetical protein
VGPSCGDRPVKLALCRTNPEFDVELSVETKLRTLVEVWMAARSAADAGESGAIRLEQAAKLKRAFPSWLSLNGFARVPAPASGVGEGSLPF